MGKPDDFTDQSDHELSPELRDAYRALETELRSSWIAKENAPKVKNSILSAFFGDTPTRWIVVPSERFHDISVERPEADQAESQFEWIIWLHESEETTAVTRMLAKLQGVSVFYDVDAKPYEKSARQSLGIDSGTGDDEDPNSVGEDYDRPRSLPDEDLDPELHPTERDVYGYAAWNMLQDISVGRAAPASGETVRQITKDLREYREGPEVIIKSHRLPNYPPRW